MPLHFLTLAPKLPLVAKFVGTQLKDPAMKALGLDPLSKGLHKGIEAFLLIFEAECKKYEELGTLLQEPTEHAVSVFIKCEGVQEALAEPFKNPDVFQVWKLRGLWPELKDENGAPLISLPAEFDWDAVGSAYLEAVRRIGTQNPELRQIWQASNTDEIKRIMLQMRGAMPQFSLDAYRRTLQEEYGTLKLSAMRAEADPNFREGAVSLQSIYVSRRIKEAFPPLDISRDYRKKLEGSARAYGISEYPISERLSEEYERVPNRDLGETLKDGACQRLVLLGDPGLGKSTVLQHLALNWAQGFSPQIPFLIELRKYTRDHARPRTFLEFLEKGTWSHCHLPQGDLDRCLGDRECLVMFDALDEVFDETLRGNIVTEIINFARDYPRVHILVTTRVLGYAVGSPNPELFQQAGFRQLTLQDFNDDEIKEFVQNWYATSVCNDPIECEALKGRLLSAIKDFPSIRELAGNPLLLTMMALLNRRKHLPRERLKLYEACAELLVEGWDAARHLEQSAFLTHDDKVEILQRVAFEMQHEREGIAGNMISEGSLKHILKKELEDRRVENPGVTARRIVDDLAERDFMLCFLGDDQFAFVHRTFLEYFCAKEYKSYLENGGDPQQLVELFQNRWSEEPWHEVLRLICAMIGPDLAGKLIQELLAVPGAESSWSLVFLASDCVNEIRQAGRVEQQRSQVREALLRWVEFKTEWPFAADIMILVQKGAIVRLARGWPDESTYHLLKHLADTRFWAVRNSAMEELTRGWRSESTHRWLIQQVTGSPSWKIRQAAMHGLVAAWADEESKILILQRLNVDPDLAVRRFALQEFATAWPHEATREWLMTCAKDHPYSDVRGEAVDELATRWQDSSLRDWLTVCVCSDPALEVRQAAARGLILHWRDESTLTLLFRLAEDEADPLARQASVGALGRYCRGGRLPQMLIRRSSDEIAGVRASAIEGMLAQKEAGAFERQLATDHAISDDDSQVRETALRSLSLKWPDEATRKILVDRACQDKEPLVRQAAVRSLLIRWRDDDIQKLLIGCLISDDSPTVRLAVIGSLATVFPNDATRELLLNRSVNDGSTEVREAARDALTKLQLPAAPSEEGQSSAPGS